MKLADLQTLLTLEAEAFAELAAPLTDTQFAVSTNGRWSVGDTAQHLFLSARPVLKLMTGSRAVIAQWGYTEAPSRTYEAIRELYQQAVGRGIKAPPTMSPRPEDVPADKTIVLARLTDTYRALADQVAGWSEDEVDRCQIPHPAIGLLSVREMLYFISIHTRHHIAVIKDY